MCTHLSHLQLPATCHPCLKSCISFGSNILLSSVTAIDQHAYMAQKRKQADAELPQPDKNQWFWRYKQCYVCNGWGLDGQDGLMHKIHTGGGIFHDEWICAECWDDPWIKVMGKIVKQPDKKPDDDVDDEDDEKAGPSKQKSKDTDAMEVDG